MATSKRQASAISEATHTKAVEQGRRLLSRGPLATAASYKSGRIRVQLNNGCAFEFPVEHAQELAGARLADLRVIEVQAAGRAASPAKAAAARTNGALGGRSKRMASR